MNPQVIQTSEIWMNSQMFKKPDVLRIYGPKFPHLRFSCPACGSLEVFISWHGQQSDGVCFDCSYEWSRA
ncbi:MAG: hypothetical protein QXY22_01450 [Candidatus Nitrosotenuis sp.]